MEKVLITCPWCGQSYSITKTWSKGSGDVGVQHSKIGCMKSARVKFNNGNIVEIRKG